MEFSKTILKEFLGTCAIIEEFVCQNEWILNWNHQTDLLRMGFVQSGYRRCNVLIRYVTMGTTYIELSGNKSLGREIQVQFYNHFPPKTRDEAIVQFDKLRDRSRPIDRIALSIYLADLGFYGNLGTPHSPEYLKKLLSKLRKRRLIE